MSAALAYGWTELERGRPWALDAYVPLEALDTSQRQLAELASDDAAADERVLLRTVEGGYDNDSCSVPACLDADEGVSATQPSEAVSGACSTP